MTDKGSDLAGWGALFFAIFMLLVILFRGDGKATEPPEQLHERLYMHIESLAEAEGDVTDHSGLIETLETLAMHPINLNTATADDLRRLFMLNELQIGNLLRHRTDHGSLISIHELQTVEGFDRQTIDNILPFITIDDRHARRHFSLDNLVRDGEHVLFLRYQRLLEEQKGFSEIEPAALEANPNARYIGSPYRLYTRYRYTWYQNVSFGITAEKDPGEEFFRGSQPQGFDFYSAHLHLRDLGRIKALSIGDYQVQFGQGLTLWSGMGFGKSSEAIGISKNGMGLQQYTSVDENNFFRGVGATSHVGPVEMTLFVSSKRRDANVLDPDCDENENTIITSLQQTGLHRTPRELEGRRAVRETITGGNLTYPGKRFRVGLTAYQLKLHAAFQRRLSFYNQFAFSHSQYRSIGLDYGYLAGNFNLFGEASMCATGGLAFLNGLMISLHPRLSLSMAHRYYQKEYQAVMAAAFGENTRPSNESGLYVGVASRLTPTLRLYAFADHFRFPWMKFRTYMPSKGSDYQINLVYKPTRTINVEARFRKKQKPLNAREEVLIRHLEKVSRTQYRLHIGYPVTASLSARNRIEYIYHRYGQNKETGFMIYHDFLYRNLDSPLAITLRYALFDTDGFQARIYAYEHDVLYAFSFPFMADRGLRSYLLVRYRATRQLDLYARLARTTYTNRIYSGSGLDRLEGNTRTEIKVQVRWRF